MILHKKSSVLHKKVPFLCSTRYLLHKIGVFSCFKRFDHNTDNNQLRHNY